MSFLRDVVIPALDAGQAGLFDKLNPKRRTRYWVMDCPKCKRAGAAYYYPGHANFQCSHKSSCTFSQSLWDWTEDLEGGNRNDTFLRLCDAAGVPPPPRTAEVSDDQRLSSVVRSALKAALVHNEAAGAYLEGKRRYPRETWDRLDIGFYSTAQWVEATLRQRGASIELARSWDILPDPRFRESMMAGRIVGWWRQPDGSLRLWGRLIGEATDDNPKYRYSSGMSRTIPYGFRKPGRNTLVCVEGPLDRAALEVLGVPASATGGNALIAAQAAYLAEQGVESILYVIDDDKAGADGALATIRNCEPRGITTFFATPGQDRDVDEMYRAGENTAILSMIETAVNGGAFLAQRILAAGSDHSAFQRTQEVWRLRGDLTPYSWDAFQRVMQAAGRPAIPLQAEALRVLSSLLADGVPPDTAQDIVARRFGLQITLTESR